MRRWKYKCIIQEQGVGEAEQEHNRCQVYLKLFKEFFRTGHILEAPITQELREDKVLKPEKVINIKVNFCMVSKFNRVRKMLLGR